MQRGAWVLAVVTVLGAPGWGRCADTPEQLLATARDGNRAAIASLRTMECAYARSLLDTPPERANRKYFFLHSGRFWRSGSTYRLFESHENFDDFDREYIWRDGRMLILRTPRRQFPGVNASLSWVTPGPVDGTGGDMWQYLLFSHWGRERASFFTFEEITNQAHKLRAAERLPSKELRIELQHDGAQRQEFWFDPKVNYLVRRCVWVPVSDDTIRWEHEVTEFAEPAPGVFVPTTIDVHCFEGGKRMAGARMRITNLKVNRALPAGALRLPNIAGMDCIDLDRNVKFRVDADGKRTGAESPANVVFGAPNATDASGAGAPPQPPPPSREPMGWWVWALIGSGALVVAGVALGVKRRRAARE